MQQNVLVIVLYAWLREEVKKRYFCVGWLAMLASTGSTVLNVAWQPSISLPRIMSTVQRNNSKTVVLPLS